MYILITLLVLFLLLFSSACLYMTVCIDLCALTPPVCGLSFISIQFCFVLFEQLRERLSRTETRVSVQTVWNRLHSAGLRARRPYVGVQLSQRHSQARLAWTRQHRQWTSQQWTTVLFTDESRFLLDMFDRRRRVWRLRSERYANCSIVEHDRYGGGSLVAWDGIPVRSRIELLVFNGTLTGQRYIKEVLQPVVLPFFQQHHVVLQDDNARPHRARIVQQFLQRNNVDHLDWPARSPDLSQTEHVWDILC